MTTFTIDTHKIAEILTKRGFSPEQASGVIQAAREVNMDALVTREYLDLRLKEFDLRLEQMELRLLVKLGTMIFALGGVLIAIKFVG